MKLEPGESLERARGGKDFLGLRCHPEPSSRDQGFPSFSEPSLGRWLWQGLLGQPWVWLCVGVLLPAWGERVPISPQQGKDALPDGEELDAAGLACISTISGQLSS